MLSVVRRDRVVIDQVGVGRGGNEREKSQERESIE